MRCKLSCSNTQPNTRYIQMRQVRGRVGKELQVIRHAGVKYVTSAIEQKKAPIFEQPAEDTSVIILESNQ
jgi:hypothetical protein